MGLFIFTIALDMLIKIFQKLFFFIIILLVPVSNFLVQSEELIIEIDNPKFSEKGLNDKVYEIKAQRGLKSENELELFKVEGKFKTEKNGQWIYLVADKGNYSQINGFIELEKNIVFYTEDGDRLQSNNAIFDIKSDIIKLNENVRHESTDGLVLSDASIITHNFKKITYEGNVISIIRNQK